MRKMMIAMCFNTAVKMKNRGYEATTDPYYWAKLPSADLKYFIVNYYRHYRGVE